MATEASSADNLASTVDQDELNVETTTPIPISIIEDVSLEPLINGDKDEVTQELDTEPGEVANISAEVSVSGGSDTESKEASKTTGEEKGHARTTSTVKKFASFKPVSVNKTFLAAKGATAAPPPKLGEKAATGTTAQTSTSAASRPRLVAKSGSGLRDSAPRSSTAANGGKPGGAPDASAVWNKNRPAPVPELKRITDEELKQQYGIHLATRLQSDDAGKQANWADIDDDDDDWAPESIEWTDGTKITLPQADDPPREPSPIPAVEKAKILEVIKPKSPAPTAASASPTTRPSGFGGRTGLILKGATEKPTLVAKPPGPPTPVKSPWASLPPVDKVAPIAIDIPQQPQTQQSRFTQRDPHGFQNMPPPPAKEIAADDFSRSSWRESHGNTSRTLFNSQSGGYEPVNDNRRGPRNDAHSRQPAVLQRPAQGDGPAEPSPAFQTHRASGQDIGYGRRRTSSNVSGGSGNFIRRMSRGHDMPPPHDMLAARRGSLAAVSDAPSSPRNFSPSGQYPNQRGYPNQQWQSRASPVVSHPSPQSIPGQPIPLTAGDNPAQAVPASEDPIEEQKKIMQKKRELAIKRRQEEEANEEAARKERIRLKLEAMGPAPEKKKDKNLAKEEKPVPTQIQTRDLADVRPSTLKTKAEVEGEAKVRGPEKVEPANSPTAALILDLNPIDRSPNLDLRPNGLNKGNSSMAAHQVSQDGRPWQSASASTADRYPSWAPPPTQQASSRNVWGPPPSNERPLGNGTFNPDLSRLPGSQPSSSHPGPIGPPNRGNAQYQQGGRGRDYETRPAPIGPPQRGPVLSREQQVALSGWATLPDKIAREDTQLRQQQEVELARKRELQAAGLLPEDPQPVYKETWRKVALHADGTRTEIQGSTLVKDSSGQRKEESTARPFEDRNDAAQPHFNDTWKTPGVTPSPQVRGSRFFPNNNRDVRLEEQNGTFDRPGSPSPPPPTMAGHPAYDGDVVHPHVSLPRPSPVVKLPPAVLAPIGPPKPASSAAAATAPPPVSAIPPPQSQFGRSLSQDIRNESSDMNKNWQDKISTLLGTKPPIKPSVSKWNMAVDSSSKHALEIPASQANLATVSLPSSSTGDLAPDHAAVTSKPAAEECFPEQEMGSLPIIKVPSQAPAALWNPAPVPPPSAKPARRNKHAYPIDLTYESQSREPYEFDQTLTVEEDEKERRPAYYIRIPGQEKASIIRTVYSRHRGNGGRPRGARNSTPRSTTSNRGRGGRDPSSGNFSPNTDTASMASSSNTRGSHQRGRGRANRGDNGGNGGNGGNGRGYDWAAHPPAIKG